MSFYALIKTYAFCRLLMQVSVIWAPVNEIKGSARRSLTAVLFYLHLLEVSLSTLRSTPFRHA